MSARTERAVSTCESVGTVVELFAGVGGFRLALEGVPEAFKDSLHAAAGYEPDPVARWSVIWANQWEPGTKAQHAFDCYASRFNGGEHVNKDIASVIEEVPEHDLLVGGFPCQDYSVAKPLNQAHGIQGHKGVLWWAIHDIIATRKPRFVLLENVDRLLKSPGNQRGRDFAIILATLSDLGYLVEWRVINAADFGFAQRRRRVFIVGRRIDKTFRSKGFDGFNWTTQEGVLARALPCTSPNGTVVHEKDFIIEGEPHEVSSNFGLGCSASPFADAGVMLRREVWTRKVQAAFSGGPTLLSEVLIHDAGAVAPYLIDEDKVGAAQEPEPGTWRHAKGSKSEERIHKGSGAAYRYSEGALPFPDPLNRPARTILTGEGGSGSSRFKHVVDAGSGRFRRLTPVELERLNGFPDGWTEGMSPVRRAFCMGNALVVGVVRKIGEVLGEDMSKIRASSSKG